MLLAQDRRFTLNTQPSHEATMATFIYTFAIGSFGIPLAFMATIFLISFLITFLIGVQLCLTFFKKD